MYFCQRGCNLPVAASRNSEKLKDGTWQHIKCPEVQPHERRDPPKGIHLYDVGPCPCECNSGGHCGGCGHAGCGGRR